MYTMFSIAIIAVMYFITVYSITDYFFGKYQNNMAIILLLLGLIITLLGKYFIKREPLLSGTIYGGYLLLAISIIGNWQNMENEYKLLLIVLSFIFMLYYFNNNTDQIDDNANKS